MGKSLLRVLAAPLVAAIFLVALLALGQAARDELRQDDRYVFALADVDCVPPPGQDRSAFLGEVQYLGSLPDRLRLLDDGLAGRLAEAFAKHPWVESVERVELAAPRQVRVRLVFRRPVLAVPVGGRPRAVDGHGVLLPPAAATDGLPVYRGKAAPPHGPAGTPWGDAAVEEAARAAAAEGRP
jgi:hypothetical protein